MRKQHSLGVALLVAACLLASGCSNYKLAPVSGRVTYKGEPVEGVDVVFYPKATDSPDPGPFSKGTTDANGTYTLVTRDGATGAVVGEHRVAFEYSDGEEMMDQESIDQVRAEYEEAVATNDTQSLPGAKRRWEQLQKKLNKTGRLPQKYLESAQAVTVPSGGTTDANFDLD